MPSDFEPVDILAQVIGVMNGPARQPQHLLLEFVQDLEFRWWNWLARAGHLHSTSLSSSCPRMRASSNCCARSRQRPANSASMITGSPAYAGDDNRVLATLRCQ